MKNLYVIFIASNYRTGRLIRFLTGGRYNHVAISLTPDISEFYSFARTNYYEPFSACYQIETPYRYLENCSKPTDIEVCEISVDDDKYSRILERISEYNQKQEKTLYNYFDILAYPFRKHLKLPDAHTCLSFVQELLEENDYMTISGFERKLHYLSVFEGKISERCKKFNKEKVYFNRNSKYKKYKRYALNMGKLCKRMAAYGAVFVMGIADKII